MQGQRNGDGSDPTLRRLSLVPAVPNDDELPIRRKSALSHDAAREIIDHLAPAMRAAAERLGEDDGLGRECAELPTRWSMAAEVALSVPEPMPQQTRDRSEAFRRGECTDCGNSGELNDRGECRVCVASARGMDTGECFQAILHLTIAAQTLLRRGISWDQIRWKVEASGGLDGIDEDIAMPWDRWMVRQPEAEFAAWENEGLRTWEAWERATGSEA